ncbi:MAG: DivIVA domain-containing protein [Betaproteobacteria bacterium]
MLTPLDIQNTVFHRSFRGYNEAEVDEFLDRVVIEYEQLLRENQVLKEKLAGVGEAAAAGGEGREARVTVVPQADAAEQQEFPQLAGELERLRQAVREEAQRLEALRNQRRLFAIQFQAMLESYRAMLAEDGGAPAGAAGEPAKTAP